MNAVLKKKLTYCGVSATSKITKKCRHIRADGSFITDYKWMNRRICMIFNKMMERCYNSNSKDYRWYGAKDIGICKEWRDNPQLFEEWSLNNGYSNNLTIDRINGDKDYCPENCRWIPLEENARRAGKVNWITVNEKTLSGKQWSEELGLGINTINKEIRKYGLEKTKELIQAMIEDLPSTKSKNLNQSWFNVYGIQV